MPTASCDSPPIVDDDDLQSLDWLQNFNLMQTMFDGANPPSLDENINFLRPLSFDTTTIRKVSESSSPKFRKPLQCTFNCMIFRAIETSPHKALQLHSIYEWISSKYDYFKTAQVQWRNSVRHCLSLNKCFFRLNIDLPDETGKKTNRSSWWTVHPDFRKAYSKMVLDEGPSHRCLPKGLATSVVCGNSLMFKRTSLTSEEELSALTNDIKAASAILTLARTNDKPTLISEIIRFDSNSNQEPEKYKDSPPVKRKRMKVIKQEVQEAIDEHNSQTEDHKYLHKRRGRPIKRRRSTVVSVETQTDEFPIPDRSDSSSELADLDGTVRIEFGIEEVKTDEEEIPIKPNKVFNSSHLKEQHADGRARTLGVCTRSKNKRQTLINQLTLPQRKKRVLRRRRVDDETVGDICASAESLLKIVGQKCPMDQALI